VVAELLHDLPAPALCDGQHFLIADLTHASNGAYWEAGYAEGLGKLSSTLARKSEFHKASHFDTNHHLTVLWETDQLAEAAQGLMNTIRATIPEASRVL
jgi:hypothetical protein